MWSSDRRSRYFASTGSRCPSRLPPIIWVLASLIVLFQVFILISWMNPIRSSSKEPFDAIVVTKEKEQRFAMSDICIGMASNIPLSDLTVFVKSFRHISPKNARLVIFLNAGASDEHLALLEENSVEIISINLEKMLPEMARGFHPSNYRWILIRDYFQTHKTHPDSRVLLADVRDAMFQRNPFEIIPHGERGVWASLEAGGTIADCGWNRNWVKDCFGDDGLQKIGLKKISCSGVTIGTGDEILQYLNLMANTIELHATCERNGIDQGVHNFLVWTGKIPGLHIINVDDGQIAHIGYMQAYDAQVVNDIVLTARRDPEHRYAIVHQYDRRPDLISLFRRLYPI